MAGLLDLIAERQARLASARPNSIAGLLAEVGARPGENLASMAQKHISSLPQQTEANLRYQMSLLGQAFPGNTYQSMMTQGNPKALAELAMQTPFNAMVAYHGTPHNILGKFDISKVGTGEGAQAYGHGMYFAENPAVAEGYKAAGETLKYTPTLQKFTNGPNYYIDESGNYMKVRDWVKNDKPVSVPKEEYLQKFNEVKAIADKQPTGNLYKVDIPDEYIPNMLDWDKPLKDQPKAAQDLAWKYKDALINKTKMTGDKSIWDLSGADLYGVMQKYKPTEKGKVLKENVDFADVSKNLNDLGIKGIRYLDEGSRSAGKGTSNFVVFDPSEVKILEKNSQKVEGLLN